MESAGDSWREKLKDWPEAMLEGALGEHQESYSEQQRAWIQAELGARAERRDDVEELSGPADSDESGSGWYFPTRVLVLVLAHWAVLVYSLRPPLEVWKSMAVAPLLAGGVVAVLDILYARMGSDQNNKTGCGLLWLIVVYFCLYHLFARIHIKQLKRKAGQTVPAAVSPTPAGK